MNSCLQTSKIDDRGFVSNMMCCRLPLIMVPQTIKLLQFTVVYDAVRQTALEASSISLFVGRSKSLLTSA